MILSFKINALIVGAFKLSLGSYKLPIIFARCVKIVMSGLVSAG
jgi:hypothetical protein